jgi:hypothetical protein
MDRPPSLYFPPSSLATPAWRAGTLGDFRMRQFILAGCLSLTLLAEWLPAASPDWLIDPKPYVSHVEEQGGSLVLSNGLARRTIRLTPNAATIDLTQLATGEQLVRAVSPEARVTIGGTPYAIGGLIGQKLKNCLTADEQKQLQADPHAYQFADWKVGPIEPRLAWKKHPEWLSTDLPWPPPGKHVVMRYVPPAAPQALTGPILLEERFQGPLSKDWQVHATRLNPRASFSNEGKAGEILSPPDACVYAEHSWPTEATSVEVALDTGDDTVSNAWGPGLALVTADRVVGFVARPNQGRFEVDGELLGSFDRSQPFRLRVHLKDNFARFEAAQGEKDFQTIATIALPQPPKALRVGKVGRNGGGRDFEGAAADALVRCHIARIALRSADPKAVSTPRADLPEVFVHYEIYDHLPLFSKWLTVVNTTGQTVRVNHFVSEELRVVEAESKGGSLDGKPGTERYFPNLWVETDMAFGGRMDALNDNHCVWWSGDPDYHTHVNYQYAPPYRLQCQPCAFLLPDRPSLGPDADVPVGEKFETFRTFELLLDSSDRERRTLAQRRMYRTIAPWTAENPLMFHKVQSDPKAIRDAIEQAHEVGFEMVIMSFGSGFNLESTAPQYRETYKQLAAEAKARGIALGGYSLLASRGAADGKDNTQGAPRMFGVMPCLGTQWGRDYLHNIFDFMKSAGLTVFENDGSYPGDCCAAKDHPFHRGLADSQWVMWRAMTDFYKQCRAEGIFLNVPDWYFLAGSNKCGMGYRETNWSLPREQQEIIERQNIFDGTWSKTASMGWMMVPLSQYHGGGAAATIEPLHEHLDHYETRFANLLGAGVQACYRGPRLYDTEETKQAVKKWVRFYKQHRAILDSDIIHLRRADGRDLDYILHVNPSLQEKGFLMVYNPRPEEVSKTLTIPLYYTGLTDKAHVTDRAGVARDIVLARDYSIELPVTIPARSYGWYVFE